MKYGLIGFTRNLLCKSGIHRWRGYAVCHRCGTPKGYLNDDFYTWRDARLGRRLGYWWAYWSEYLGCWWELRKVRRADGPDRSRVIRFPGSKGAINDDTGDD